MSCICNFLAHIAFSICRCKCNISTKLLCRFSRKCYRRRISAPISRILLRCNNGILICRNITVTCSCLFRITPCKMVHAGHFVRCSKCHTHIRIIIPECNALQYHIQQRSGILHRHRRCCRSCMIYHKGVCAYLLRCISNEITIIKCQHIRCIHKLR